MKTTVKIGLAGALVWIIITLIAFLSGESFSFFIPGIFINILGLLATIGVAMFVVKKEDKYSISGPFLQDFKDAMQAGVIYTIVIAGFIYVYHSNIDPSILNKLREAQFEAINEAIPDAETYQELLGDDNVWRNKSYDDYIENQEDNARIGVSPGIVFFIHFAGLFMFSFFYSFFVVLILRKIVLKPR